MLELILSYILDEAFVTRCFWVAGLAGPPLGAGIGHLVGTLRGSVRQDRADGLLIGLFGTFVLVMWYLYNAIVEALGLDTVKNLVVNVVLFAVLGVVMGFALRRVRPWLHGAPPTPPAGS